MDTKNQWLLCQITKDKTTSDSLDKTIKIWLNKYLQNLEEHGSNMTNSLLHNSGHHRKSFNFNKK